MLDRIRIVLVGTTHPGNIGAVARSMKAMGLGDLALVAAKHFPAAEATARAAGADDLLVGARVTSNLSDAIKDSSWVVGATVRSRHIQWPVLDSKEFATKACHHSGSIAVMFGREHAGLTNDELDCCQAVVTIPTVEHFCSLNVAAAVQILAYDLRCAALARAQASPPRSAATPCNDGEIPVTSKEMEGFYAHLAQTLVSIGYLDRDQPRLKMRRLRRLFNRATLSRPELNILRGVLSAVERPQTPAYKHRIDPQSSDGF